MRKAVRNHDGQVVAEPGLCAAAHHEPQDISQMLQLLATIGPPSLDL